MKVLLSIKPHFAKLIFGRKKRYEYRKALFKRDDVDGIIVYASSPTKRIIGEITIGKIIHGKPQDIWEETSRESGIDEQHFFDYFRNHKMAYAIQISSVLEYDEPIDPRETITGFIPPQSFMYWEDGFLPNIYKVSSCQ